MSRTGLVVLQVVGGLSLLPYPFILVANVMSIASPKGNALTAIPYLLLSAYPIVWIVLWVISWVAMARGAAPLAFGLSSIPVAASLVAVAALAIGEISIARSSARAAEDVRRRIEPANPLLWAVWSTAGELRSPAGPSLPVEPALAALEAHPDLVNVAVAPYGTPLFVAVSSLSFSLDGTPNGDARRQQDLVRLVRALHARGASLDAAERLDLRRAWLLKLALHEGPITTAEENLLVWRLVTRKRDGVSLFSLRDDEVALLNHATRLHGTPLYAAMLEESLDAYPVLINAGARLSEAETAEPAAAAGLLRVFQRYPELQRTYERSR